MKMKKLLLLIACLWVVAAHSQIIFTPQLAPYEWRSPVQFDQGYVQKGFVDTTAANVYTFQGVHISTIPGYSIRCGNNYFMRDATATIWLQFSVGPGGSACLTGLKPGTGIVTKITDTTFIVGGATFGIGCTTYQTRDTTIKIANPGDTGRLDIFLATTAGVNVWHEGTEGITNTLPAYGSDTAVLLAFALVTDTGTTVTNIVSAKTFWDTIPGSGGKLIQLNSVGALMFGQLTGGGGFNINGSSGSTIYTAMRWINTGTHGPDISFILDANDSTCYWYNNRTAQKIMGWDKAGNPLVYNMQSSNAASDSMVVWNPTTKKMGKRPVPSGGSFTLTNGSGTTAAGTAVNLGGTLTTDAEIDDDGGLRSILIGSNVPINNFYVTAASHSFIGDQIVMNAATGIKKISLSADTISMLGLINSSVSTDSIVVRKANGKLATIAKTSIATGVTSIATTSPITGGTITATGTIGCATCVVATVNPSAGVAHFAGSTQTATSSLIVNSDITNSTINLTQKVTGALPIANGGTNNGSLSVTAGSIYYGDGSKLVALAPGTAAQHLTGGTIPSWKDTAVAGASSGDTLSFNANQFHFRSISSTRDSAYIVGTPFAVPVFGSDSTMVASSITDDLAGAVTTTSLLTTAGINSSISGGGSTILCDKQLILGKDPDSGTGILVSGSADIDAIVVNAVNGTTVNGQSFSAGDLPNDFNGVKYLLDQSGHSFIGNVSITADALGNNGLTVGGTAVIASLSGSGNRIVVADAGGTLSAITGTVPQAGAFSGVGTATTSFVVTLANTQANNTYEVNVTPTSLLGAAVFYISAKTTTTFTVTYLSGLTGTVTFDYAIFPN